VVLPFFIFMFSGDNSVNQYVTVSCGYGIGPFSEKEPQIKPLA
jgi:hypothetical protein